MSCEPLGLESARALDEPSNLVVAGATDADCPDFDISDPGIVNALLACQRDHFWHRTRNHAIVQRFAAAGLRPPAPVLEVGCGTGTVLRHLRRAGYRADGIEMHYELSRRCAQECPSARVWCLNLLEDDVGELRDVYQAVALFDVLEHIADEQPFLTRCRSLVGEGGWMVGTVPALPSLFSRTDVAMGHHRRYTRESMRSTLENAGLHAVRLDYFFRSLAVPMWLSRVVGKSSGTLTSSQRSELLCRELSVPPRLVNAACHATCRIEDAVARRLPVDGVPGASLFFAARAEA